jgi:hypothetical protein
VRPKPWHAELALLSNALIWGVTFQTVKNALSDASPILFVAVRFSLAAIILILLYFRKLDRRMILPGCFVGLLLFARYAFQTAGMRFTSPQNRLSSPDFRFRWYLCLLPSSIGTDRARPNSGVYWLPPLEWD